MNSETNHILRLPVIEFSVQLLKPKTPEWEPVKAQVLQALEEFGCFEASFQNFPVSLKREFFESAKEFFDLPLKIKKLNVSSKPFQSYTNGRETKAQLPFEAVTVEVASIRENVEIFANLSWPQGNRSFCNNIESYTNQVSELDKIIRRMIFESLGIEKYLENHFKSTKTYSLRLTKYEESDNSGIKQLKMVEHTDKGLINVLSQNQVDGLEVQTKDGQWIQVKPSPCSFVAILGEALAYVLANGRLHCPLHRVMISGNKPRYSVGLICNAEEDYMIETPKELVDKEYPLAFKPYDITDFLRFFVTSGKTSECALKDYCGV